MHLAMTKHKIPLPIVFLRRLLQFSSGEILVASKRTFDDLAVVCNEMFDNTLVSCTWRFDVFLDTNEKYPLIPENKIDGNPFDAFEDV